jgi:peptidyl-Lys metalloendopeptidase
MHILSFSLILSLALASVDIKLSLVETGTTVSVNVTFINPSSHPISILNWYTPLEGVRSNMFRVTNKNGVLSQYLGMEVRRGPEPLPEEFTTIASGQSISVTVDLSQNYLITEVGYYEVRIELPEYVGTSLGFLPIYLDTVPATRTFEKNIGAYTNCASGEINTVEASLTTSRTLSLRSYNCLNAGTCYPLSTRWFGAYSDANYNYDTTMFRSINARLTNSAFSGYCNPAGCGNNVYGYVYPSDTTFTVYLCTLFWTIPNERVNTIIHEMSHFNSLGGTGDFTYGQSNCLNLARTNPNNACQNADNVCYFASEA